MLLVIGVLWIINFLAKSKPEATHLTEKNDGLQKDNKKGDDPIPPEKKPEIPEKKPDPQKLTDQ